VVPKNVNKRLEQRPTIGVKLSREYVHDAKDSFSKRVQMKSATELGKWSFIGKAKRGFINAIFAYRFIGFAGDYNNVFLESAWAWCNLRIRLAEVKMDTSCKTSVLAQRYKS